MTPFNTSREIRLSIQEVFAAICDPERLARWWGPAGFTNTFHACDFKVGGGWSLTMYSPDGKHFRNECVFGEIEAPSKVVVEHVSEPKYRLTIGLEPSEKGTVVSWSQAFANPEVARKVEHIVVPANDQNLERLESEVASGAERI